MRDNIIIIGVIVFASFLVYASYLSVSDPGDHKYQIEYGVGKNAKYDYTDSYEEKDGCATFIGKYGANKKVCGSYSIVTQK